MSALEPTALEAMAAEMNAAADDLRELLRADKIRRGINPDAPERTIEQMRAETIALRARNDQDHAEMVWRYRTSD